MVDKNWEVHSQHTLVPSPLDLAACSMSSRSWQVYHYTTPETSSAPPTVKATFHHPNETSLKTLPHKYLPVIHHPGPLHPPLSHALSFSTFIPTVLNPTFPNTL